MNPVPGMHIEGSTQELLRTLNWNLLRIKSGFAHELVARSIDSPGWNKDLGCPWLSHSCDPGTTPWCSKVTYKCDKFHGQMSSSRQAFRTAPLLEFAFLVFSCLPWEDLCGSLIVCIRTSDRADRADRAPGKTSFKGRCTCCTAPKFVQGFLWRLPSLFCATSWTGKTWSRRLCREVGKKQVSAEWVHSCPFSGKGSFMWKWTSWSLILEHVVRTFDPVGIYLFLCLCRDNLGQTGLCACVVWVPICVPVYVEAASLCHSSGSCEEVCATFARAANWSLLPACWAFRQCTAWHSCNFDMLWAPMNINEHKSKLHFEGICFSLNILRRESSKTESNLRQIHS
jgi:hypothetical protein